MRKHDVQIGSIYIAEVTGLPTLVKILAVANRGGWIAINTQTGHRIRIRTATRLRRPMSVEQLDRIQARVTEHVEANDG